MMGDAAIKASPPMRHAAAARAEGAGKRRKRAAPPRPYCTVKPTRAGKLVMLDRITRGDEMACADGVVLIVAAEGDTIRVPISQAATLATIVALAGNLVGKNLVSPPEVQATVAALTSHLAGIDLAGN